MVVRRYVVKDMPEAVLLIRKELGKEAVILSTRKIYVKKWMGFWRAKRIEVMAAAGADMQVKKNHVDPPKPRNPVVHKLPTGFHATPEELSELEIEAAQETRVNPNAPRQMVATMERRMGSIPVKNNFSNEIGNLHNEIQNLKVYISQAVGATSKNDGVAISQDEGFRQTLLNHLMGLGFSHPFASKLIANHLNELQYPKEGLGENADSLAFAKRELVNSVLLQLGAIQESEPIHTNSRVVMFVGPTGVGKTTTIAKLAAMHVLSGKRKVGLITTDTFRIAAVEQLKTYAGILNVPLGIIHPEDEIIDAFQQQGDRDLILIDTTGRNYRDPLYVEDMARLMGQIPVDETYLVLPMTGKTNDLYQLVEAFEKIQFDKLLFTKMDETSTLGSVVELLSHCKRPLSYVTTGQSVPDDLEIASLEKIVTRAFGEEA